MLTKLSTCLRLPLSYRLFFRSLSLSSVMVTVTFALTLYLSSSAWKFLITVGESSHLGVYASIMLSSPASISSCILSIPFDCRPYLLRSKLCTLSRCHQLSAMTSMTSESHFLPAQSSTSQCSRSSMLFVAAGPISPLRFPFLIVRQTLDSYMSHNPSGANSFVDFKGNICCRSTLL